MKQLQNCSWFNHRMTSKHPLHPKVKIYSHYFTIFYFFIIVTLLFTFRLLVILDKCTVPLSLSSFRPSSNVLRHGHGPWVWKLFNFLFFVKMTLLNPLTLAKIERVVVWLFGLIHNASFTFFICLLQSCKPLHHFLQLFLSKWLIFPDTDATTMLI